MPDTSIICCLILLDSLEPPGNKRLIDLFYPENIKVDK
jgi:hypothetical protein